MQEDDSVVRPPDGGTMRLPEPPVDTQAPVDPVEGLRGAAPEDADRAAKRSLFDDFEALFDDARTYVDAELSYQKSRAGFVADRLKKAVAFGLVGAYFGVLATVALAVGLIIALTPLITAWGATALVVIALLLIAFLLIRRARQAWNELSGAMNSTEDEPAQND
ncbi:MAG: phage holin family protein [Alteraurantiacibacter sp. bin_em_oilr2.035]|uniref:phage holin family protein n=1 Tax=Aurantiacibacter atlanticus TaxID=1648404 RepID=UPI000A70CB76|nr:phage holin family protein [Aurantiacibacter atlanticus]MDF1834789.1 phage holin family protein [Alteraurantiacibacter sp. bin_em_oilr2.035]